MALTKLIKVKGLNSETIREMISKVHGLWKRKRGHKHAEFKLVFFDVNKEIFKVFDLVELQKSRKIIDTITELVDSRGLIEKIFWSKVWKKDMKPARSLIVARKNRHLIAGFLDEDQYLAKKFSEASRKTVRIPMADYVVIGKHNITKSKLYGIYC